METIFALCSAPGKAGVAVIRVSGPEAWEATRRLCGTLPDPRQMAVRVLRDKQGNALDEALIVCFEKKRSFTGEDICEFHLHGSTAVISAVLTELSQNPCLKSAEPGEFTRQALENGRLDLAQVEGLADLIDAETEMQRRQAQRVLAGAIGDSAKIWREDLIRAACLLEATIDFVDEDVPVDVMPEVSDLLKRTMQSLQSEVAGIGIAERLRDGFEVVIVGPPNVGKSTLLNALAGREAAITSQYAGTTRDVVEVQMDLNGLPVVIVDTAGIRETNDPIEKLGIERAVKRAQQADLRVFLCEAEVVFGIDRQIGDIQVVPKGDLKTVDIADTGSIGAVSGLTGEGVETLMSQVASELKSRYRVVGCLSRVRHKVAATAAMAHLDRVLAMSEAIEHDIVAEEIRAAVGALRQLVGAVGVEDVLDSIFASFCIGK
ncbi:MAG: tRNA uridine-5-carboxymethylaminomethyl(34) synthesis GTPase MnmE [Paracoccaceae bacterium]|nr:tRNA uridine-5-carboxymethylaminomethyl(34) synthesis GTPase MnmE [Paracoccaceae bacterium]